jgi:hypothetical protein
MAILIPLYFEWFIEQKNFCDQLQVGCLDIDTNRNHGRNIGRPSSCKRQLLTSQTRNALAAKEFYIHIMRKEPLHAVSNYAERKSRNFEGLVDCFVAFRRWLINTSTTSDSGWGARTTAEPVGPAARLVSRLERLSSRFPTHSMYLLAYQRGFN